MIVYDSPETSVKTIAVADSADPATWSATANRYVEVWGSAEPLVQIVAVVVVGIVAISAIIAWHMRSLSKKVDELPEPDDTEVLAKFSATMMRQMSLHIEKLSDQLDQVRSEIQQVRDELDQILSQCPACPFRPALDNAAARLDRIDRRSR